MNNLPYSQTIVIIPTYNEAENVVRMIAAIDEISPDISVLIIDDGSPDGTGSLVKTAQESQPNLFLIQREAKLGLGSAYKTGYVWATDKGFQYFVQMDCDFSHDPAEIRTLLNQACAGYDLVIGSRFTGGVRIVNWPIHRLLLSYAASIYTRYVTGMPIRDPTSGYKCLSRKTIENIDLDRVFSNGYAFQIEINFWAWSRGLKLKESPIIFYERRQGKSKMGAHIVREAILTVVKLRLRKLFRRM